MNASEVKEIKKAVKAEDTCIQYIAGCYVDGSRDVVTTFRKPFLSLEQEEMFKYSDILKKTLTGTVGKNLINAEFSESQEECGTLLNRIRKSGLKDNEATDRLFTAIREQYDTEGNFLILLFYGVYDIPGKTTDNETMEDASEDVYTFLVCSICPVMLSEAGLVYDKGKTDFENREQDWMVKRPETGFLFPSFNDREPDIHSFLYYVRNAETLHREILEDVLGCAVPATAKSQKEMFDAVVENSVRCSPDEAVEIHKALAGYATTKIEDMGPDAEIGKEDIRAILSDSGMTDMQTEKVESNYDTFVGDSRILASNISSQNLVIESDDVKISVAPGREDLLETRDIDGIRYIMIPVTDNMKIDGIKVL